MKNTFVKSGLPTVVIVGRTNVGKSTLFNRLSVSVKSITLEYEGVTRDFLKDTVCWQGICFELIDTGGISLRKETDPILIKARQQALALIEQADVVLFMCDGTIGVLPEDQEIAQVIHKLKKSTIVVVNKADVKATQERMYEFQKLGFKAMITVSAQHSIGIGDLLEHIISLLPQEKKIVEEAKPLCRVVILGKPNVGKSSLMNLLLKQERTIVADQPGTTREAITERVRFYKEDIQVTDTPGLRRSRRVQEPLEQLMVKSALRALASADLILLLIDTPQGRITDQELKLAFYAFEEKYKAVIILFNKTDLLTDEYVKQTLKMNIGEYKYFLDKVPQLYISCKTGENVGKVLVLVDQICQRYNQWFDNAALTRFFKEELTRRPLFKQERRLEVYEVKQIKTAPITIAVVVNEPKWFEKSQLQFFENSMRKNYDIKGVPIKFVTRRRKNEN